MSYGPEDHIGHILASTDIYSKSQFETLKADLLFNLRLGHLHHDHESDEVEKHGGEQLDMAAPW